MSSRRIKVLFASLAIAGAVLGGCGTSKKSQIPVTGSVPPATTASTMATTTTMAGATPTTMAGSTPTTMAMGAGMGSTTTMAK